LFMASFSIFEKSGPSDLFSPPILFTPSIPSEWRGGEGGTALERYGKPDWITHCFTAGGTVLNALGNEPIPYLQALYLATQNTVS